jgi:hypothetical protein
MKDHFNYFLIKIALLVPLFIVFSPLKAILASFAITWGYQYVIATVLGLKVMPTTDVNMHLGNDKGRMNYM